MMTVCDLNNCTGCMACVDVCPKQAISVEDSVSYYNAVINVDSCIGCDVCRRVCHVNHSPEKIRPQIWHQGWATNKTLREQSASGGFATEILRNFLESGGVAYSCVFENGEFIYKQFCQGYDISVVSGSKYVKSNPKGIYKKVKQQLTNGQKVLFVGLPCHVAALLNFVEDKLKKNLYTIDLICHGTPSPKILDIFLRQHNLSLDSISKIRFRHKNYFQVDQCSGNNAVGSDGESKYQSIEPEGVLDSYILAFLRGVIYTENCYECKYATIERVSDLTLGDSWGSELAADEVSKGISLALCQSDKGEALLKMADIHLEAVDLNKARLANHQLNAPSQIPKGRNLFFTGIKKGKSFDFMIWRVYPVKWTKQIIKRILIKIHIL